MLYFQYFLKIIIIFVEANMCAIIKRKEFNMKKTEIKTKIKEGFSSAEELIRGVNERMFNASSQDLVESAPDLNFIDKVRNRRESNDLGFSNFRREMERFARQGKHINPPMINKSMVPTEYLDDQGKKKPLSEMDSEPKQPTTLPAVISKEIMASGINKVKWTNVEDLPGSAMEDIRMLGNAVFKYFNLDDNADVLAISSFKKNDFLNTPLEVNSVLGFLNKNTTSPHTGTLKQDYGNTISNNQGYCPEIKLFHTESMAYLAVFEPEGEGLEGNYVYAFKRKTELKLKNEKKARISNKPS